MSEIRSRPVLGPWQTVNVTIHGAVAVIELSRPERLNALSPQMKNDLEQVWLALDADAELRVGIVTGHGQRAFCSGADVATVADPSRGLTGDFEREMRFTPMQLGIGTPTICAVNGVCAGAGLHFVTDCDFAIAAESATFVDTHVNVGQVSAIEPIGMLSRMSLGNVMRMVLLGKHERMSATRAVEVGLVTETVADDALLDRALELANMIDGSPAAIAVSRQAIVESLSMTHDQALRRGLVLVRQHADHHPDAQEGPAAFSERRAPVWAAPSDTRAGDAD